MKVTNSTTFIASALVLKFSAFFSSKVVEFPEFTICVDYDHTYKDKYGITNKEMRRMNYPKHNDTAEFYKLMTYEISEIVDKITIKVRPGKFSKYTLMFGDVPKEKEDFIKMNEYEWFIAKNRTSIGRCFSFHIPKWIKELKVKIFLKKIRKAT